MKSQLNEIKRLQRLAGILKEAEEVEPIEIKLNVPGYGETIIISNEDDIKDYNSVWGDENSFGRDLYNVKSSINHSAALRIYNRAEHIKDVK
jgi:hypothetical protein